MTKRTKKQLQQRRSKLDQAKFKPVDVVLASYSVDAETLTADTFEIEAYTGDALDLPNFDHSVYIDCATATVQGGDGAQGPLLMEHDGKRPVGHGYPKPSNTNIRIVEASLSFENEDVETIRTSAGKKFSWQVSVGAKLTRPAEYIRAGQQQNVNGRVARGPCFIARGVIVRETSFCALGRDLGRATAHIAAMAGGLDMNFEEWLESLDLDVGTLTDDAMESLRETYAAAHPVAAEGEGDEVNAGEGTESTGETVTASAASGASSSATVVSDIQRAAREAAVAENQRIRELTTINASYSSVPDATRGPLHDRAINGEINSVEFERDLLRASRSIPQSSGVGSVNQTRGYNNPLAMEVAMLQSQSGANMKPETIEASLASSGAGSNREIEQAIDMASHSNMRNMRASNLCYALLDSHGITAPSRQFDRSVLEACWGIEASAASTTSLRGILTRSVNTHMMAEYNADEGMEVVNAVAGIIDSEGLRPNEAYRLTSSGQLEPVATNGEVKSMSLGEELTPFKPIEHAKLLHLGNDAILDKGFQVMFSMSRKFARMGANAVHTAVIEALTMAATVDGPGDESTFFRRDVYKNFQPNLSVNLFDGVSLDSVNAASILLEEQTDSDGESIGVSPNTLLCSPKWATAARTIYSSQNIVSDGREPEANGHVGLYMPVKSKKLGLAKHHPDGTSNVKDVFFMIAKDGSDIAPVILAYEESRGRAPIVREFEQANRLGITLRGEMIFCAVPHDARTVVKSQHN